jgi:hypothetical protein
LLGQSFLEHTYAPSNFETARKIRTIQSSGASSVENASKLLLAEVGPRSLGAGKRGFQMDFHDLVPFLVGHILEPEWAR